MPRWQDVEPEPYPEPRPGEKIRMIGGPVDPPDAEPAAELSARTDGTPCDWRRTVAGLGPGPAASREDHVRWSGDLRRATTEDLLGSGLTWR
jgi:hypothetical protein